MRAGFSCGILLLSLLIVSSAAGKEVRATVVYDDRATQVTTTEFQPGDASQLWLTTTDLARATGFEVKPQGVCREEMCFPLPKSRQQDFLHRDAKTKTEWFNLTAFAALVHQAVAHDDTEAMWYFSLRSDQQQRLASLRAPDFKLPDMAGKMHSLSDFRGKKVLLVTWASW